MANTISNIKMTNPIKGLVSKRRKRYTEDGFNLDLTYIKPNLIAMGYPAEKLESVYRNDIDDVVKFLESKHKDHYKIYNLCSERSYDCAKFHKRVAVYPFDDHNPPQMELIQPFCADVHAWLSSDPNNVAVVHCKAGKGRTGTMVCCYLLHSSQSPTASDALNFYGQMRTLDRKGVTIPSQRRYVNYYAQLVKDNLKYAPVTLFIREVHIEPLPNFGSGQSNLQFCIYEASTKKYVSSWYEIKKGSPSITLSMDESIPLTGDIKLEFSNKPKMKRKEKLFHFWFNTFFVQDDLTDNGNAHYGHAQDMLPVITRRSNTNIDCEIRTLSLTLDKWNLDDAHKDKQNKIYSADFKVSLLLQKIPRGARTAEWRGNTGLNPLAPSTGVVRLSQDTPSESSEADSTNTSSNDEEDGWESGECVPLTAREAHLETHGGDI